MTEMHFIRIPPRDNGSAPGKEEFNLGPGRYFRDLTEKYVYLQSAADVKMEIPVLVRSLKSSILRSTSLQRDKTFWGVVSAAVEQSRREANMVAQGDGKFGP